MDALNVGLHIGASTTFGLASYDGAVVLGGHTSVLLLPVSAKF
jgi:hypothetical protein